MADEIVEAEGIGDEFGDDVLTGSLLMFTVVRSCRQYGLKISLVLLLLLKLVFLSGGGVNEGPPPGVVRWASGGAVGGKRPYLPKWAAKKWWLADMEKGKAGKATAAAAAAAATEAAFDAF